ncbi:Nucleolar and coiled-body phospho 1 [Micractinium conductrix]|uniref:Nucleolar and coiled-body phospho 1 n=1 Tax=Micractinium conductrix TaxID=554055 RepID=A0A2P6V2P2_9CHLO|nr:Nucleolar and coiled-body phospho 1 [Micractinium conductrix]|eukprot:PSC68366.1 Nucleolar and coiled-body phospho 1 [Micractinium conductrix]
MAKEKSGGAKEGPKKELSKKAKRIIEKKQKKKEKKAQAAAGVKSPTAAAPPAAPAKPLDPDAAEKKREKRERRKEKAQRRKAAAALKEAELKAKKPPKNKDKYDKVKRAEMKAAKKAARAAALGLPTPESAEKPAAAAPESGKKAKKAKKAKKRKAEEAAATKAAPAGEQQQEQQQQAAVAEEAEAAQPAKKKRKTEGGAVAAEQQAAEPQADEEQQNGGGEGGGEGGEGSDGGYVSAGKEGTAARAFQRVKADEWLDKKGAWDNSYVGTFGQNGWGWKAQEVLGKVRGKDFRHEKTKKKRGSYKGGEIDPHARCSYKFEDSDNDLSLEAYQRLGGTQAGGSLAVAYRAVECAPPGNASVSVLAYRDSEVMLKKGGYLRLVLSGVAGTRGISSVELRQTPLVAGHLDVVASTWRRMHNEYGASWEVSGVPAPPLDLRVTDGTGRQLLARGAILAAGQLGVFPTRAQFPPSNSTASVAAAGMAALALPEMASALEATTLPPTDAALPPLAVGDGAMGWSPLDLPAEPVSEAPTPAPAWPADGSQCTTILGVLATRRSFTMLLALIRTAGLEGVFADPAMPLTLFAPTNRAWRAAVAQLPLLKYTPDLLRDVILQHVLASPKRAADFTAQASHYDTLAGGYLTIKSTSPAAGPLSPAVLDAAAAPRLLVVSQASAAATTNATDLPACLSVVHGVNAVLLPQMSRRRS